MKRNKKEDSLLRAVSKVLSNDNCSGCGACALISDRISMVLSEEGYLRPEFANAPGDVPDTSPAASLFREVCPGVRLRAPSPADRPQHHPSFGSYISVWEAWACDEDIRFAGSSGGVLTALGEWLVRSGRIKAAISSAGSPDAPTRTVPVRIMSRKEFLASAGSRYAPVSNIQAINDEQGDVVLVGKPCEISALRRLQQSTGAAAESIPVMLSFFCAGTPSQKATDHLAQTLGTPVDEVAELRYRGNGWPGNFAVKDRAGNTESISYDESWGQHLGRTLQWRCKLCPDGVGEDADVAVGDYWDADKNGYPVFADQEGRSVAIARTKQGHQLLMDAAAAGAVYLRPASLDNVAAIQPLQVQRRTTLLGRLTGRLLAGKRIPRYSGYGLSRLAGRNVKENLAALRGTRSRSLYR
ncbi:Coenzyme F420 hydrogenase/dehydrogenase, beta subunit C-terminal domain [Pseudarthrobacter sp. PvP090]|uniref:Coenzyme F420 hydrogenase/dehydrogenase, beta subunit C-terminal domain n=1 Tax=Pseudarthrobacter sp. PvP090 TaxID=3156393 RepID=UPI00339A369A